MWRSVAWILTFKADLQGRRVNTWISPPCPRVAKQQSLRDAVLSPGHLLRKQHAYEKRHVPGALNSGRAYALL